MLQLIKVRGIRKEELCYCGKQISNSICEEHGTEIRVDNVIVDTQLQIVSSENQNWKSISNLTVDISFPRNQFLKYFKSQNQHFLVSTELGESIYELTINRDKSSHDGLNLTASLLDFLNNQCEFQRFLGENRYIIRVFRIKWKSAVSMFYFLSYRTISDNTVEIIFSVAPLRRLSNYISWRLKQFRAKKNDIEHSLVNSRSSVIQSDGTPVKIVRVNWDQSKRLPSEVIVSEYKNSKSFKSKLPTQLYQGNIHFFIGQRRESEALMGLETIAYEFLYQFEQFLTNQESHALFVKKLQDEKKELLKLIGSSIKPRYEILKIVGDIQNNKLRKCHLDQLRIDLPPNSPKNLLIISCSGTKSIQSDKSLSAIKRYLGTTFFLLKSVLLNFKWPDNLELLIVSAKYGLLSPLDYIPYYEKLITSDKVSELQNLIKSQIAEKKIIHKKYIECHINVSKYYFQAITDLHHLLKEKRCKVYWEEKQVLEKRNDRMMTWIGSILSQ